MIGAAARWLRTAGPAAWGLAPRAEFSTPGERRGGAAGCYRPGPCTRPGTRTGLRVWVDNEAGPSPTRSGVTGGLVHDDSASGPGRCPPFRLGPLAGWSWSRRCPSFSSRGACRSYRTSPRPVAPLSTRPPTSNRPAAATAKRATGR